MGYGFKSAKTTEEYELGQSLLLKQHWEFHHWLSVSAMVRLFPSLVETVPFAFLVFP